MQTNKKRMQKFWRKQDTKELETQSLHIDIPEILVRKDNEDIEDLLELYADTIELRDDSEGLRKALREGQFEDKDKIGRDFPLRGLCGWATDSDTPPAGGAVASGTKYAVLYEGEYIGDCGDGDIFVPEQVLKVVKI